MVARADIEEERDTSGNPTVPVVPLHLEFAMLCTDFRDESLNGKYGSGSF